MGAMCKSEGDHDNRELQHIFSPHYRAVESSRRRRLQRHPDIVSSMEPSCKKNSIRKNIYHPFITQSPHTYRDGIRSANRCYEYNIRPEVVAESLRNAVDDNAANVESYVAALNDIALQLEAEGLKINYDKMFNGSEGNQANEGDWYKYRQNELFCESTREKTQEGNLHSGKNSILSDLESYDSGWREKSTDYSISDDLSTSMDGSLSKTNIFEKTNTDFYKIQAGTTGSIGWADFKDWIKSATRKYEKTPRVISWHETLEFPAPKHDHNNACHKRIGDLNKYKANAIKANSAGINLVTWDEILKYKQRLQSNKPRILYEEEKLKKAKLDADHGERVYWKTRRNGRRSNTPDAGETIGLESLIPEVRTPTAIYRVWNEDSHSIPFTASNTSQASREVERLNLDVGPSEEKIINQKRAPIVKWSGPKTLALCTQSCRRLPSPKTAFLPSNSPKENFLCDTHLRGNNILSVSAYPAACGSSYIKSGTVLEAANKIKTVVTQVIGDEQTMNIKRYKQELAKPASKSRFFGHSFTSTIKKELGQGGVNGKNKLYIKDEANKRYNGIAKTRTCDLYRAILQDISHASDAEPYRNTSDDTELPSNKGLSKSQDNE